MNNNLNEMNEQENFHPSSRRKKTRWWIPVVIIFGVIGVFAVSIFAFLGYLASSFEKFGGSFEPKPVIIASNTILKLDFSYLNEINNFDSNPFSLFNSKSPKPTFYQVISSLKEAAKDPNIIGIYYEGTSYISGAMAKELQIALLEFKKSNKFIYSYLETSTKNQYYTALPSDSIFIPEEGIFEFSGYGISSQFMKGLYDKIGVDFTVVQCEDFKTAAESYKNKKFSDSSRLAYKSLISQQENEFISTVSQQRGISNEKVIEFMSKGIIDSDEMIELKLADVKISRSKFLNFLRHRYFPNEESYSEDFDKNIVSINDYVSNVKSKYYETTSNSGSIAIIYGEGPIVSTDLQGGLSFSNEPQIVSQNFIKLIQKAQNNDEIKGIIIRINSPGGSVIASEEIYQAILEAKKTKPVYASMSNVAASGGYYISMACDTIIAHSNTVTGSIGVVSVFPNVSKLLDNLYITTDTISNGIGNPFFLDPSLPRNFQNEAAFEKLSRNMYKRFLTKAANCRKMNFEQMQTVAKGRVWVGSDAFNKGLVDVIGDFQTAINLMKTRIGLDSNSEVTLKFLPEETDKWTAFMKLFENNISVSDLVNLLNSKDKTLPAAEFLMIPEEMQNQFKYWRTLAFICEKEKVVMALPQVIEVK